MDDDQSSLTRADLCARVHGAIGLSRLECSRLVDDVLRQICDTLGRGDNVKLSNFGSFVLRHKGERRGRNPKTGEEVRIGPRRVLAFRPSQAMRARVAAGPARPAAPPEV